MKHLWTEDTGAKSLYLFSRVEVPMVIKNSLAEGCFFLRFYGSIK